MVMPLESSRKVSGPMTAALMAMVNDVMNRPEGAKLMAQLQAKLPDQDKKR